MLKLFRNKLLFAISILLWSASLYAQPTTRVEMGGDVRWFDWREHDGANKQILMETGPLGSVQGAVTLQQGNWYARMLAQYGLGATRYNGHLQNPLGGLGAIYKARAYEQIAEADFMIGWRTEQWDLHASMRPRYWHRFIQGSQSVSSAEESYRWLLATMGGEYSLGRVGVWRVSNGIDIGLPVISEQTVYSQFYGNFDLEPGNGSFVKVSFPFRQQGWTLTPYFQVQDMAASNAVRRQAMNGSFYWLHQPASIRREMGLSILKKLDL